jgi:hypothetical protein
MVNGIKRDNSFRPGIRALLFSRRREYRLYGIVGFLLMVRLAFNWFVIPQRIEKQMKIPHLADQILEIVKDKPLYIAGSYPAGFYDAVTYSIEVKRNEILRMAADLQPGSFYLMDEINLQKYNRKC